MRKSTLGIGALLVAPAIALSAGAAHASPAVHSSATMSGAGSIVIGKKPIRLTQPVDTERSTIVPTADAPTRGMFGPQVSWPVIPVHVALARNGHLVSYGTPLGDNDRQAALAFDNWNPALGFAASAHVDGDTMGYDSFCNSLVELDDGTMLMVGGNSSMSTMIYNPFTDAEMMGKDLNKQRWYATSIKLTDGRILVLGGQEYYDLHKVTGLPADSATGTTPEIGSGTGAWHLLPGAANTKAFGAHNVDWFYPRAFIGPKGGVVGFSNNQLWSLSVKGTGHVNLTGTLPYKMGASGSQVMYAPGKVLVASGGSHGPGDTIPASSTALTVDFTGKKPVVSRTGDVLYPGNWLNLTVMPTGAVFANGGTRTGVADPDYTAEIWNPRTGKWHRAGTAVRIRTYHSVALMLPSGAVFTGGGGAAAGPENNDNAELYYPAYLFTRHADGTVGWAARPRIDTLAGSATYGGTLRLGMHDSGRIKAASLISLARVTHSENTDQRRVPLTVHQHGRTVSAVLPKSVNTLPPGDYELTAVNAEGVASPAQIVTIRKGAPGLVTRAGA